MDLSGVVSENSADMKMLMEQKSNLEIRLQMQHEKYELMDRLKDAECKAKDEKIASLTMQLEWERAGSTKQNNVRLPQTDLEEKVVIVYEKKTGLDLSDFGRMNMVRCISVPLDGLRWMSLLELPSRTPFPLFHAQIAVMDKEGLFKGRVWIQAMTDVIDCRLELGLISDGTAEGVEIKGHLSSLRSPEIVNELGRTFLQLELIKA